MEWIVYILCAVIAFTCCVLLLRGYRKSKARLLLWSGLCFAMFTLDNVILFIDKVIIPSIALSPWQTPIPLIGVIFLLYGLVWEAK